MNISNYNDEREIIGRRRRRRRRGRRRRRRRKRRRIVKTYQEYPKKE
jgi:hypothetical protein